MGDKAHILGGRSLAAARSPGSFFKSASTSADPEEMEQRLSSQQCAGPPPPLTWSYLGSELILVVALWGILGVVSGRIPDDRGDYGFIFTFALVIQSIATLRFFTRASQFASLRCEACDESYHGAVVNWFRRRESGCAHCGARFDESQPRIHRH